MKKLLHPLADPVFKRIFGTEKEILIEFINTFIKLEAPVVSIEYLPTELIPFHPHEKFPVVDVRCRDACNRQFILEIQLSPQPDFVQRAIYYASRAYERQLLRGHDYGSLEPVYILSLLDFNNFHDTNDWHHEFSLRHYRLPELVLSGFHLSFLELKKLKKSSNFKPESLEEFWMLFLTEPEKLMNMPLFPLEKYPNIEKAIELLDESKYTPEQLVSYDRYLDSVRTWNSTMIHHYDKGWLEGIEKGREEGIEKGIEEGINQGMETERNRILAIIKAIKKADKTLEQIALEFNEPLDFIQKLID